MWNFLREDESAKVRGRRNARRIVGDTQHLTHRKKLGKNKRMVWKIFHPSLSFFSNLKQKDHRNTSYGRLEMIYFNWRCMPHHSKLSRTEAWNSPSLFKVTFIQNINFSSKEFRKIYKGSKMKWAKIPSHFISTFPLTIRIF